MADKAKTNNATPESPGGPPTPEQTEQAVIPGMDGGPAPSGKVIDLSDVRAEAGKTGPEAPAPGDAPPEQGVAGSVTEYTKQEWERPLAEIEAEQKKPRRDRPPKADRAALPRPKRKRPLRPARGTKLPARASGPPPAKALPRPRSRRRPLRLNRPSPVTRPAPRKRKLFI